MHHSIQWPENIIVTSYENAQTAVKTNGCFQANFAIVTFVPSSLSKTFPARVMYCMKPEVITYTVTRKIKIKFQMAHMVRVIKWCVENMNKTTGPHQSAIT